MKISIQVFFLSLVTLGSLGQGTVSPLDWIPSKNPGESTPVWVSTELAIDSDRAMRWEFFRPGGKRALDALISMAGKARGRAETSKALGECYGWTSQKDLHEPLPTLKDLHDSAIGIFTGVVRGESQGFIGGWPGTLYEVAVERDLKTRKPPSNPQIVYVYFPWAKFVIGDDTVCHRGIRGEDRPRVGKRMLAFAIDSYRSDDPLVFVPDDGDLFFERIDGSVSLPFEYGAPEQSTTFEAFLIAISEQIDSLGEEQ